MQLRIFPLSIKYHCLSRQVSFPWRSWLYSWPIFVHTSCLMFISLVYLSVSSQCRCRHATNKICFMYISCLSRPFITRGVDPIFFWSMTKKARGCIRIERQMEQLERGKGFESLFYYLQHSVTSHTHCVCLQSMCASLCFDSQYVWTGESVYMCVYFTQWAMVLIHFPHVSSCW